MLEIIKNEIKAIKNPFFIASILFVGIALIGFIADASTVPSVTNYQSCLIITTGSVSDIKLSGVANNSLGINKTYSFGDKLFACSASQGDKIQGDYPQGSILNISSAQNNLFPLTYIFENGTWQATSTIPLPEHTAMSTAQVLQYYGIIGIFIFAFGSAFTFFKSFILRKNL